MESVYKMTLFDAIQPYLVDPVTAHLLGDLVRVKGSPYAAKTRASAFPLTIAKAKRGSIKFTIKDHVIYKVFLR